MGCKRHPARCKRRKSLYSNIGSTVRQFDPRGTKTRLLASIATVTQRSRLSQYREAKNTGACDATQDAWKDQHEESAARYARQRKRHAEGRYIVVKHHYERGKSARTMMRFQREAQLRMSSSCGDISGDSKAGTCADPPQTLIRPSNADPSATESQ